MDRLSRQFVSFVFAVLFVAACGDPETGSTGSGSDGSGSDGADGSNGVLAGRALFEGDVPPPREIVINKDSDACASAAGPVQDVVVSAGGGLAGVVVEIRGLTGDGDVDEKFVVHQKNCAFSPGLLIIPAGAELEIHNDDPVAHNVNTGQWNIQQSAGSKPITKTIAFQGRPFVRINCNIHSWMEMWVYVARSPFHTVTDAEGNFRIDGVPPGTYKVSANHPTLGSRRFNVTIEAGQTAGETVTFK